MGFLFLLTPPFVYHTYKIIKGNSELMSGDNRSELEIYNQYSWADTHFWETSQLSTTYYDYITWRRNDYIGKTINIENGIRHTVKVLQTNNSKKDFWFFGGSTTWGTGVSDAYTYPSLFAQSTSNQVTNFGETGYIAPQSLAFLMSHLLKNEKKNLSNVHVVFYDGVNDVLSRCRAEIKGLGTDRENQFQTILKNKNIETKFGFDRTFGQLKDFLNTIAKKLTTNTSSNPSELSMFKCSTDSNRALEIAQTLVNTWQLASDIVESRGGKFTAILQPVSFYGKADVNYLNLNSSYYDVLSMQFEAVYPLIIELAQSKNVKFLDLTSVYDDCSNCYIDFCHVGPQAHKILTKKLISELIE